MTTRDASLLRAEDLVDPPTGGGPPGPTTGDQTPPPPRRSTALAWLRNIWRQLTSMKIALVLLFLLALASLPGALLPQWSLNQSGTAQFIVDHPTVGPILNKLGFFAVFGSPWYAAIYLALFISLIGCLIPRTWDFTHALRAEPVPTPRNLGRLPLSATRSVPTDPAATEHRIRRGLRGWRVAVRDEPGGVRAISAEKGFLREVGNLLFHFSLLGILGAVAVGKMFGFEGTVVVTEGSGFCSGSPAAYDTLRPGLLIDGTDLAPFCVDVDAFEATYTTAGAATDFTASVRYQTGVSADPNSWTAAELKVNEPLRINGERLYLLGHGYTPEFTITFPDGEQRTASQVFQPSDGTLLSEGVVKILDPPGYTGDEVRQHQLALQGLFAPTALIAHDVLTSAYPAPENPAVAIQVYRGDLGMEDGRSQSIFQLDQNQVDSGALTKLDRANLALGESMTLNDGTVITFSGYKQWVQLQTSYDPAQGYALVFAITLLTGLMCSLLIKRRRVWYRIRPAADSTAGGSSSSIGSTVDIGGLARTDQAGYGEEFARLVRVVEPPGEVAEDRGQRGR